MKNFLSPKTYVVQQEKIISGDEDIENLMNFDLEEVACQVFINELKLINQVSKSLDCFYNDSTFVVYDIIRLLNQGEDSVSIDENSIEYFCRMSNIELSHNEMKILLFYLQCDKERKISYSQLKKLFKHFVISDDYNSDVVENHNVNCNFHSQKVANKTGIYLKDNYGKITMCDFLISLGKYEKILYNAREKIFNCEEIIPIELFYLFDLENKNSISQRNFKDVLNNNFGLSPTNEEIKLIFHNYSYENEYEMSYDDFKRLILPYDKLYLPEKMIDPESDEISPATKHQIIEMFKILLTFEVKIEKIRLKFVNDKNFSPYEQFLILKGKNSSKITKIDKRMLYNYLIENVSNGETIDDFLINLIYNRMDLDKDLLISYDDFAMGISPIDVYQV